jgi:hypothetical protein
MNDKTEELPLTASQMELLRGMVRCFQANTGKLPSGIEEITDHWYEIGDHVVIKEHIDEDGRYHPAETVKDVEAPDHMVQAIWLRQLEKRPDADAIFSEACRQSSVS